MFLLYKVTGIMPVRRFELLRETHLFGCNQGLVARYLRTILPRDATVPYKWHFSVSDALTVLEPDADAFVIELKPNQYGNASRYEVATITGYSDNKWWTPAMLAMRALLVDQDAAKYPREAFVLNRCDKLDEVYTFLHFSGGVENGLLSEKWAAPGPSPTNSALLWREVLEYFASKLTVPLSGQRPRQGGEPGATLNISEEALCGR